MKKLFTALILFLSMASIVVGQTDCCTEINRPEPGEGFLDALSICFLDDEIECFSMRPAGVFGPMLGCPSGQLDNPHTYILFPNTDTFQLRIESANCGLNSGIQVMLYRLTSNPYVDDCINLNPQVSIVQTFCASPFSVIEFIQSNAKDEIYYLLIDGFQMDVCDYTIASVRGEYRNAIRDSVSLSGPSGLPAGYTATYTAERFSFDCFRTFDCQCGICGLDTFGVSWTGPPGAIINPIPGTLSADVTMGNVGGSLCIRIKDDCENLLQCIQLEVTSPEFYIKCPTEFTFAHGEVYGSPGVFYPEENNRIYEVTVEEYPDEQVVNFIDACIGDQLMDCLFNVIEYPVTDNYCEFMENDTCKSVQTYITWHQSIDTTIYDTICFGTSVFFCGAEILTAGITDCDILSIYGCDSNTHLVLHILPPDSIFLFDTLCNGSERLFCNFDIDIAGIYSCQDTTPEGCIQFTILQVTVDPIDTTTIDTILCAPEVLIFRGNTYTAEGIYSVEEVDAGGCVDRYIINLMYDQLDTTFVLDTVCQTQPYNFCDMTITDPGIYYCTFEMTAACDSVVELTLVSPCRGVDFILLCPNEELVFSDTTISNAGIYYIPNNYSSNCTCIDTLTVEYSDLGSSQILASAELSCENDTVDLSFDLDLNASIAISGYEWFLNDQLLSIDQIFKITEPGTYFVGVEYINLLNGICYDTIQYTVAASEEFNPTLTWIDRELALCDSNLISYHLAFESDAPRSILTLLNTNEEWINQNDISIDLPNGMDVYNFRLTLQSDTRTCEEVFEFEVNRLSLSTTWPDTIFISNIRTIAEVENPLIDLNPPATNVFFSPSGFIDDLDGTNLIFNPLEAGQFNLSFNVGACEYNYNTVVVRNSIFVPNAFSPNNDGINDQFLCYTSAGFNIEEVKIFNRWGVQVFSSNIDPIAWNGRSKDKAQAAGVYVVQYMYSDRQGNVFMGVSELLLIR